MPPARDSGAGVGEFEKSCQDSGAWMLKAKVAFRSGCSKTANARRDSGVPNCVYRYVSPSTGSVIRCRPSPVFM